MDDIFTEMDLGSGNESVQTADAAPDLTPAATSDSPAAAEPAASTDATPGVQDEQVQDGTQQQQPTDQAQQTPEQVAEAEVAKLEQEVEAALADPRTPKWFKNTVENVYKPKLAESKAAVDAYSQYGTPEELASRIELLSGLETIRSNPNTGMPERTTEPFVKSLFEKDPQGVYQLMSDLVTLPSPYTQGRTVLEEVVNGLGIDPARIDDVKKFAANGYQMQASAQPAPDATDLETIPAHLHATFGKLDPDTRDELMVLADGVRDRTLEAYKNDFEKTEREAHETQTQAQTQAQEAERQQAAFKQQVDTKGEENWQQSGEAVLNSFVDTLAKSAGMTKLDSLAIANTVLNAFEPTLAGRATLAQLKAEGIDLDQTIPATIVELQEKAKHVAYYQLTGDQAALTKAVSEQVSLQEKLIGKSNKVVAQLAQKRNGNAIAQVQQNAAALAQTQNSRHAAAGSGRTINSDYTPTYDISEEGYAEAMRNDPHFKRG